MNRRKTSSLLGRLVAFGLVVDLMAAIVAIVLPGVATAATAAPSATITYSSDELAFVALINQYRQSQGLSALLVSDAISDASKKHSFDMSTYNFFSHYSVKSTWFPVNATPWTRMAQCGYSYNTSMGENIAAGQPTAQVVFDGWKGSPDHNANMLNAGYKVIGIGLVPGMSGSTYRYYWTTDFGGYVDATAHAPGSPPVPVPPARTRYEQTAAGIACTGTWTVGTSSSYSGSSYKYSGSIGATVSIAFKGTSLDWIAKKSASMGTATVSVDGGAAQTVNLYSLATLYKQNVWTTGPLDYGLHTVKITRVTRSINVDAVDVTGGTLATASRFEQNAGTLAYSVPWPTGLSSYYSKSSYAYTNATAASVTVNFNGVSLAIIARQATNAGLVRITLDPGTPAARQSVVDLYYSYTRYKQTVWSSGLLVPGDHTVKIECLGQKRAAATGTYVNLDAVDVIGTLR
jgi:uncharacterized protein YkwD